MTGAEIELDGTTLLLGPSNVGKTRRTAEALERWIAEHGTEGVVVLEFGPAIEHEGRLLGGRLERFTQIPDDVWLGVIDARAPRVESSTAEGAMELARANADRARRLFERLPPAPTAVFVNDATIPFQADGDPTRLTTYCDTAAVAVLNAFDSDELGTTDAVSRNEQDALSRLESWADAVVRLS